MAIFCRLCGARTDGRERLGSYCPGERCGTDLRAGEFAGVQAWCEPDRLRGEPGRTVGVRLVVRNAGSRPDTFRIEPVERVDGRLDFDAGVLEVPLAPGRTRTVDVDYTLPRDRTATGLDIASRFGVPGADAAGRVDEGLGDRVGVALRVVSVNAGPGGASSACAAFAVDVPGRFRHERQDGNSAAGHGRSVPLLVGGAVLAVIVVIAIVVALTANKDGDDTATPSVTGEVTAPVSVPVTTGPGVIGTDGSDEGDGGSDAGADAGADGGSDAGSNAGSNAGSVAGSDGGNKGANAGAGGGNGGAGDITTPPGKTKVKVPNVTTLADTNAAAQLEQAGFTVRREYLDGTGGPRGLVQSQEPAASTLADKGSTVVIRLRDGKVTVPDVVGKVVRTARDELEKSGFVVEFAQSFNAESPDRVVSTDPAGGELAPEGSTVVVTTD